MTVAESIQSFLRHPVESLDLKRSKALKRNFVDFLETYGNLELAQLRLEHLEGFQAPYLSLTFIRRWLRWATHQGHLAENPGRGWRLRHPGVLRGFIPTQEQMRLFLEIPRSPAERMLVAFLYGTGLLPHQAAVDLNDLALERQTVAALFRRGKRMQPLGPRLVERLRHYIQAVRPRLKGAERCSALFLNAAGQPMKPEEISNRLRNYSRQMGVKISGCAIRHAFAVHLLENGAPLEAVQSLMGHKDVDHTARYATYLARRQPWT